MDEKGVFLLRATSLYGSLLYYNRYKRTTHRPGVRVRITALDSRYRNEKDPLDPLHLLLRFLYTTFLIGKADYAAPTS